MRKLALLALVLAGCVHAQEPADHCRARTDFRPGTTQSCCQSTSWIWNGHACIQETGHCSCECVGPDCDQGYPTLDACMEGMATCRAQLR